MKQINQGDIYMANLDPIKGHEQAGLRPVLILQNNILNRNLNTVIIAPLTSNVSAKGKRTTEFLPKKKTGLRIDSVALFFQIRTLDKSRLIKEVGHIGKKDFSQMRVRMMECFY
jgi:mRNA interferase MazF